MNQSKVMSYEKDSKLDKKDKKILEILDKNARSSIADISRRTGIPRDSVMYRIKKMERQEVIRFFHTVLNPNVLNYPIYCFVNFVLQDFTEEETFLSFLKTHPNIVYVAKTTGKWDFTINIAAKNLKHFDEIMMQIRKRFPRIIKDYETASIIQEYKYDKMVDLIE